MKTAIIIIVGVIICYLLQTLLPIWWIFVVLTLLLGYVAKLRSGGGAFFVCWLVVFTTWVLLYIIKDIANDSVMSSKMANLFSMKSNYWLFGIVSAVMGILGGLTGVAGYYLSKKS